MEWGYFEGIKLTFSYVSSYPSYPSSSHSHNFLPRNNWGLASPCHSTRILAYFSFLILQIRTWPPAKGCQDKGKVFATPRNLISHHICLCVRLWVGINPQFWPTPGALHQPQEQHSSQPVVHADSEIPGPDSNLHKLVATLPLTWMESGSALQWDNYRDNLIGRLQVNDWRWMRSWWAEGRDSGRRE